MAVAAAVQLASDAIVPAPCPPHWEKVIPYWVGALGGGGGGDTGHEAQHVSGYPLLMRTSQEPALATIAQVTVGSEKSVAAAASSSQQPVQGAVQKPQEKSQ